MRLDTGINLDATCNLQRNIINMSLFTVPFSSTLCYAYGFVIRHLFIHEINLINYNMAQ